MNILIQNEVKKFERRKLIHSIRLFLDVFFSLLICQWLYSALRSLFDSGELKILWMADWIFIAAPIFWVCIISVLAIALYKNKQQSIN